MKAVTILILLVAAGIAVVSFTGRPLFGPVDTSLTLWVNNAAHCRALNAPMWAVSHMWMLYIMFAAGISVLLFRGRYGQLIVFILIFWFCFHGITVRMKKAAFLPRPYEAMSGLWYETGHNQWVRLDRPLEARRRDSFPSGHAFSAFFFVGVFHRVRRMKWFFWAAAILIAFSRMYLGVHYLSDVIFGAMAGFAFGAFFELLQFRSLLLEGEK
ncbi:MAG: phosphatase PAP2 family protein [Candidatus Tritonobacter lacicola]|nr:phosphatase PAP2 family protein [Candidatus Tritonobacter lacicola]